jgi:hypothetical protein
MPTTRLCILIFVAILGYKVGFPVEVGRINILCCGMYIASPRRLCNDAHGTWKRKAVRESQEQQTWRKIESPISSERPCGNIAIECRNIVPQDWGGETGRMKDDVLGLLLSHISKG